MWIEKLEDQIRTQTLKQLCAQEGSKQELNNILEEKQELTEEDIYAKEMAEFEKRSQKMDERNKKLEQLRRETLGSARQQLVRSLFNMVRYRRANDIEDMCSELEPEMVLELPSLVDESDGGKTLIHKCAQVSNEGPGGNIILNYFINLYKSNYTELMLSHRQTVV